MSDDAAAGVLASKGTWRMNEIMSDGLVALAVGLFAAWSPVTTAKRLAFSIGGGLAVAIVLFGYRRWTRTAHPAPPLLPENAAAIGARWFWGGLALLALCLVPTLPDLLPFFTESVWRNCHGLFIPLLMVATTRSVLRRSVLDPADGSVAGGLPLILLGLGCLLLDLGVRTLHFSVLGLALAVAGMVCVFFGWKGLRALAGPIALILFLMPIPSALGAPLNLPTLSAATAESILRLFDFTVLRRAWILDTPMFSFAVSVRCGGWGLLYAALAFALAFGTAAGSWKRGLLLAILAWPVTIFANGLRLAILFAYCEWRNVSAEVTPVHGFSGILAFLIVFGLFLLIAGREARDELVAY